MSSNSTSTKNGGKPPNSTLSMLLNRTRELIITITGKPGVYSRAVMAGAGLSYVGDGDKAKCNDCGLEVSNLTSATQPFTIHSQRSPDCPFVRSTQVSAFAGSTTTSREAENSSKRRKTETIDAKSYLYNFHETCLLEHPRQRSFSHWPHRTTPSAAQMIEAGFFCCNVGDRVICLYCNLICQQWTPHTDDPCEVHKILSPDCIFVKTKLMRPSNSTATTLADGPSSTSPNLDVLRSHEIVHTAACNPTYIELPKRYASFFSWPRENLPFVDDFVRSGFFYTGTKTIITCFYCNGSLQNWGPNDNPMIEHARWFPHCAYAKQLCGDELYRKIQELKRAKQERARANELRESGSSNNLATATTTNSNQQLQIPDESTLSRLVAARLDLPVSQQLLSSGFKLSIIKRCWEDQLRLKHENFISDDDLWVACIILQKQIQIIDGKKENIVIPSVKLQQIRELKEARRKAASFREDKETTILREISFIPWPHASPSRLDMLQNGWKLDTTKGRDTAICIYCGCSYRNWQPGDNPKLIHSQLSPTCVFPLATKPIEPNQIPRRLLADIYHETMLNVTTNHSPSPFLEPSTSSYALPPRRESSFENFPGGPPQNTKALVQSGLYYTGNGTTVRCYNCGSSFSNIHQRMPADVNRYHRDQNPNCQFVRILPPQDEPSSSSNSNLCQFCCINEKQVAIYPCRHFILCQSCAAVVHTCPKCGGLLQSVFKVFT